MHYAHRHSRRVSRTVRTVWRLAPYLAGGLLAAFMLLILWAYYAVHREPEFYVTLLQRDDEERAESGDVLEQRVLQLHNDARREGTWETELTSEQINGWLAVDLPGKFPATLPRELSDPRVMITEQEAHIACRYSGESLNSVISIAVQLQLTDEPNEVAIRVLGVRAGALWLPLLESSKQQCTTTARRHGAALKWAHVDGDDVALLKLPLHNPERPDESIRLEEIALRDGSLYLSGSTSRK